MRAVRECERSEYSLVCAYALTQLATHLLPRPFFPNPSFRSDSIRVRHPSRSALLDESPARSRTLELLSRCSEGVPPRVSVLSAP